MAKVGRLKAHFSLAQHTKQNYSIKITILCVPKKRLLGDFTEDKTVERERRQPASIGSQNIDKQFCFWQPPCNYYKKKKVFWTPVNYKCAFLWHVTELLNRQIYYCIQFHIAILFLTQSPLYLHCV